MSDKAHHLGTELKRAINRMDFFRLFKAMTLAHGYTAFALCDIPGEAADFRYARHLVLHSLSDKQLASAGRQANVEADPIVCHILRSVIPVSLDNVRSNSPLADAAQSDAVTVIPLHTPSGRRHALVLFGDEGTRADANLAIIAHEAVTIFQHYFEAILSLETITGLNDRELQIVRWTSEGKTSAEIAIILGLSEHTVNSYTAAILRKLHVVNRAQMVATAIRTGLIN